MNICTSYAEERNLNLKILHKLFSNGKPSALNYGLLHAHGEIVGIFDGDNVPSKDALLNVCRYFEDPNVAAVQGRTMSINPDQNMLTKFISHEETIWCEAFLRGKDVLNLFVHLKGSCQFFKRDVLEELGGFDESYLSEDMEISARLTQNDYKIRYAGDVQSLQESPPSLKQLFTQRTRWFRGCMEVAFKYGKLMAKPSKKRLDAEATLLGPFIALASLVAYAAAFSAVFIPVKLAFWLEFLMQSMAIVTTLIILLGSLALIYSSKQRKLTSLLWVPFIYFYWSSQVFIALYAMFLILLRRPRRWMKTEKSGEVTGQELVPAPQDVPPE